MYYAQVHTSAEGSYIAFDLQKNYTNYGGRRENEIIKILLTSVKVLFSLFRENKNKNFVCDFRFIELFVPHPLSVTILEGTL